MKRRRIACIFMIMVLALVSLTAKTIEADGSGETRELAISDAKKNLGAYFSMDISSEVNTTLTADDTTSSSTYNENVSVSSRMKLFGVKTTIPEEKKGIWYCKAYIDEDAKDFYIARIKEIRPLLEKIDMKMTGSQQSLIEYYTAAKIQYRDWDTYSMILSQLTDGAYVKPELPVTLAEVDSRYNALLRGRDEQLEIDSYLLDEQAKKGKLSEEDKARREEIAREREVVRAKMDTFAKEQAEFRAVLEAQAGEDMKAYLDKLDGVEMPAAPSVDVTDPVKFILGIEDYRNVYRDTRNDLSRNINQAFSEFEKQAEEIAKDRLSAKRMNITALVDSNGLPTPAYLEKQMEEALEPALMKAYRAYYENARKMYDAASLSLENLAEEAEKNVDILNRTQFSLSRFNGDISSTLKYSLDQSRWNGTAYFNIAGQEVSVPFHIPYRKITGHYPSQDWNEFGAELDFYHKVLVSAELAYDVQIRYHIEGDITTNKYLIKIDEIVVINPLADNEDRVLYSATNVQSQQFSITYNTTDMTKLSIDNKFDITEMLPQYKPLGLMPNPDLTIPELPELRKASPHSDDELPEDPVTYVHKERLKTGSDNSFGAYITASAMFDTEMARGNDMYSLGIVWRGASPMFGNAHFRIALGGTFSHLNLENMKAGGNVALGFANYINSYTYAYVGAEVDAVYGFDSQTLDIIPVGVLGLGGENHIGGVELDAFCGCSMNQNDWKPELLYGVRVKTNLLFK